MLYQLLRFCSVCIECRALMEQYWQGKTEVLIEEPVFCVTLSTANLTWTVTGLKPGLAQKCLSQGTPLHFVVLLCA